MSKRLDSEGEYMIKWIRILVISAILVWAFRTPQFWRLDKILDGTIDSMRLGTQNQNVE